MIEQLFSGSGLWAATACRWHAVPTSSRDRGANRTWPGREKPARPARGG
jgi:hypothetical protein